MGICFTKNSQINNVKIEDNVRFLPPKIHLALLQLYSDQRENIRNVRKINYILLQRKNELQALEGFLSLFDQSSHAELLKIWAKNY